MNCLDSKYIRLIESDVESARITINNLSQELVDHICCEVESLMSAGKTFEEAYALIKEQAGIKVLQKIQENTLYLIDKKYKAMKTTMKITGNVSLALIAIGTAFKIYHWAGASILLILGFTMLCFAFFPAAIYMNYTYKKEQRNPMMNLSILAGGIIFMAGVLFKLMHWPGAAMLLFVGWSVILGIFLPILLFVKLKQAENGRERSIYILGVLSLIIFEASTMFKMFHWPGAGPLMILGSTLLIAFFVPMFAQMKSKKGELTIAQFIFLIITSMYAVALTFLMTMNVSDVIIDRFVRDESNSSKIISYFEKKRSKTSPENKADSSATINLAIAEGANKIHQLIVEAKLSLIKGLEGVNETEAMKMAANPHLINMKTNYDVGNHILLEKNNDLGKLLREEIETFRKNAALANPDLAQSIEQLLSTSGEKMYDVNVAWDDFYFGNSMAINTMAQLSEIERNVRMVESLVNNN